MTYTDKQRQRLNELMAVVRIGHDIPRECIYVAEDDDGSEDGPMLWLELLNPRNHGERLSLYPNPGFFVVEHVKYDRERNAFVGHFRHELEDNEVEAHLRTVWKKWSGESYGTA